MLQKEISNCNCDATLGDTAAVGYLFLYCERASARAFGEKSTVSAQRGVLSLLPDIRPLVYA